MGKLERVRTAMRRARRDQRSSTRTQARLALTVAPLLKANPNWPQRERRNIAKKVAQIMAPPKKKTYGSGGGSGKYASAAATIAARIVKDNKRAAKAKLKPSMLFEQFTMH